MSYTYLAYGTKLIIGTTKRVPLEKMVKQHKNATHFIAFKGLKLKQEVKEFKDSPYIEDYETAVRICKRHCWDYRYGRNGHLVEEGELYFLFSG